MSFMVASVPNPERVPFRIQNITETGICVKYIIALVSHRNHSLGLTSNRHKTALHPRRGVCVPSALRNEASGARDLLVDVPVRQHHHSNRKAYEKLELDVTPIKPIISIFLIVRKTHFIQGEPAQFPCSSARSRTPRFGLGETRCEAQSKVQLRWSGGRL